MSPSLPAPLEPEARTEVLPSRKRAWQVAFVTLAFTFAGGQLLDFATTQGLSSIEPKGYFVEANPLLAQIADPFTRACAGFALKVAVFVLVVGVARLQRRRIVGTALLLVGTLAGLFGAWSNMNPWGW